MSYRDLEDPVKYAVSKTLKQLRKEAGLSQLELAAALKMDRSTYTCWETATTNITLVAVFKLCDILNAPPSKFFKLLREFKKFKEKEIEGNVEHSSNYRKTYPDPDTSGKK